MNEPTMDDWRVLRRMVEESIANGIRSHLAIDAMAEDLQHVFNRWATDRELSWANALKWHPGKQVPPTRGL
jgi:hypothetical protein